jgi:hypothetical protein
MAGAVVHIRFVAGSPRDVGYSYATPPGAVLGAWTTTADDNGDFTVTVPTIGAGITYPATGWYECTIGGGRWPKSVVKTQPTVDGTYVISDPAIIGTDLLPPEFTQVDPTADDVSNAVDAYFATNPIDVDTEVDAALAANPPLYPAGNLDNLDDPSAALTNIGGAPASVATDVAGAVTRLDAIDLAESADPALRTTDLEAGGPVALSYARFDHILAGPGIAIDINATTGTIIISATPVTVSDNFLTTESGDALVTQSGDLLVLE